MMTVETNQAAFNRTLDQYIKVSGRTIHQACLAKAFDFLRFAIRNTKMADVSKIRWKLGQVGVQFGTTKRGKISKSKKKMTTLIKDDSFAARIVRDQAWKRGLRMTDAAVHEAAIRKIDARAKSSSYLRAGWIPATKAIAQKLFGKDTRQDVGFRPRTIGVPKGWGKVKTDQTGYLSEIELANSAVPKKQSNQASGIKIISEGAEKAMRLTTRFMQMYLNRKMREDAKQFGITTN